MDLIVYDEDDRRYVPWPVAAVGVVVALLIALLASAGTYVAAQSAEPQAQTTPVGGLSSPDAATAPSADPDPSTLPTAPVGAAPEPAPAPAASCPDALAQADAALERAGRIEQALTEHTRLMEELLAERLSPEQALDRTLPVLTEGATDRQRFFEELAAYRAARDACPA